MFQPWKDGLRSNQQNQQNPLDALRQLQQGTYFPSQQQSQQNPLDALRQLQQGTHFPQNQPRPQSQQSQQNQQNPLDALGALQQQQNPAQQEPESMVMSGLKAFSQGMQNSQSDLEARHRERVFAANPEYAAKIYGPPTSDAQQQQLDINAQQQRGKGADGSPGVGGATGELLSRIMAANPGMTITQALVVLRNLSPNGQVMVDGEIENIGGRTESAAGYAGAVESAKTKGDLNARLGLEAEVAGQRKTAESNAEYNAAGQQSLALAQRTMQGAANRNKNIADKVKSIKDRVGWDTTGIAGNFLSGVPGTNAYDLRADIETIKATVGFDRLEEMRRNSPTGAALGNVTERELSFLQASISALEASQSKDQLLKNLETFEEQYALSMNEISRAYQEDYGRFGGKSDTYLPAPPTAAPPNPGKATTLTPRQQLNEARLRRGVQGGQ